MFLSLILLLVLSLIFTIIEGARVSTAKIYAQRALSTAMDSVLAEYYGPLWEEYHVFGYYTGEGSEAEQKKEIETKLTDYMSYTFEPDKGLDSSDDTGDNELFDISIDSLLVNDETILLDYQGQLLINEAVEYMKYQEVGDGTKLLLDKLSLLESPKEISYVYEEKQKVEKELVEVDKGILALMELLDGLKTSKKGIEVNDNGKLKTAEYFVKKICFGEVTKESVGINQDNIFLALKGSYFNPSLEFDTIKNSYTSLKQVIERQAEVVSLQQSNSSSLSNEQAKLEEIKDPKSSEGKKQIKEINKAIKGIEESTTALNDEATELENTRQQLINTIITSKSNLSDLISGLIPIINEANSTIDNIILKTEAAAPLISQYEEILKNEKELLDGEVYTGLEENLNDMKKYIEVGENGYDFEAMKSILKNNLEVLTIVQNLLDQGEGDLSAGLFNNSEASFDIAATEISRFQISGLTLDYSTFAIDSASQKSPLNDVNNLLQAGISSFVIDPNTLSDGELTQDMLPSQLAAMSQGNTDFLSMLSSFFESAVTGDNDSGSLFESFGNESSIISMAGEGINKVVEHFLFQEYLKEHFEMYSADKDSSLVKPSALKYEQEYLLVGKYTDQENLSSIISRIVFLRTILDFASLLGDSAKRNEAKAVAVALVGFTGLPILVGITQVLILLIWAFAEALLDVCALMMGKEVPILKKKTVLEFPDLFLINREYLQSKATAISDTKEISFSYQDYLRVFLLMKSKTDLAYRSMDLMQENIKMRYAVDTFHIKNCFFGYKAAADFTIASKFTSFYFVQKYLDCKPEGFQYSVETAYSY